MSPQKRMITAAEVFHQKETKFYDKNTNIKPYCSMKNKCPGTEEGEIFTGKYIIACSY